MTAMKPRRALGKLARGALALLLLAGRPAGLEALSFDPLKDGIALGVSAAFAGAGEALVRFAPPIPTTPEASFAGLAGFDTALIFPYDKPVDVVSTVLETAAMLTPLALSLAMEPSSFLADAGVYGEFYGLALGSRSVAKYLLPRYRPYTYEGGATGVKATEDDESFPSGHATMSFVAAAFSTYLYVKELPRSAPFLPIVLGNYALAGVTGSFRVLAGMHYPSDVLAGAVLGMVCGLVVPLLVRG
jgi:undecaprenyl-diphosphatase